MATTSQTYTQEVLDLAGSKVELIRGGSGDPLVIFHDEMGHPGWMRYHEALAQSNNLHILLNPGAGQSEHLDWVRNMRDLAIFHHEALEDLGLNQVNAIGLSFGGWLAAEMAAMSPERFKKLVLVSPMGIQPPSGEIFDMFMVVAKDFITRSFLDPDSTPEFQEICPEEPTPEQAELWELARESSCHIGWKPYMYAPTLPHWLRRLSKLPTLIVSGRQDAIVPLSAAEAFHQSIPGSKLTVIDNCGHRPEVEKTDEFVKAVKDFL